MSIVKEYGYVFFYFRPCWQVIYIQHGVKIGQVEWVAWDS